MCECYLSISSVWRYEVGCCHWEESPQWKPPVLGCWSQVQGLPHHWGALEGRKERWSFNKHQETARLYFNVTVSDQINCNSNIFSITSQLRCCIQCRNKNTLKSKHAHVSVKSTNMPTCYVYGFFRGEVLCAASVTHKSAWSKCSHEQHVRQTTGTLRPAPRRQETETQSRRRGRKECDMN